MINMIKADLYRMLKSRGMWFFWGALALTYLVTLVYKQAGGINLGEPSLDSSAYKMDVQMVAHNFTYYYLFIIPVFCIITADFSAKTIKNTITSAISRKQYFITKFTFTELFHIAVFLLCNLLFYPVNRVVNGTDYASSFSAFLKPVLLQLPLIIGFTALFILLAFVLNKASLFNSITIIAPLLYATVSLVLYGIKGTKDFAEKILLKYELNYMLQLLATDCTAKYRNTCLLVGVGLTILSFLLGYLWFTHHEPD